NNDDLMSIILHLRYKMREGNDIGTLTPAFYFIIISAFDWKPEKQELPIAQTVFYVIYGKLTYSDARTNYSLNAIKFLKNTYSFAHSKISITNFYSRQHHEKLFFDMDPNVIGSTSLNPKIVGGRHVDSLLYDISSSENPTSRTHFYFDSESNIGFQGSEDGSASTATKYGGVKKILNSYVIISPPQVSLELKTSSLLSCNYPLTNPNTCRLQSSCALRKLTALKKQMGGATSHNLNAPGNFSVVSHRLHAQPVVQSFRRALKLLRRKQMHLIPNKSYLSSMTRCQVEMVTDHSNSVLFVMNKLTEVPASSLSQDMESSYSPSSHSPYPAFFVATNVHPSRSTSHPGGNTELNDIHALSDMSPEEFQEADGVECAHFEETSQWVCFPSKE
ncbi:hypothetical protein HID58_037532, partial [Brassica napus]